MIKIRMLQTALCLPALAGMALAGIAAATPAHAQFRQTITNDPAKCASGSAVSVTITDLKPGGGILRIQLYRSTGADWLEKGRWLHRIELPAKAGSMNVCMPVPQAGEYGIAVRHDLNKNGKTDLREDGGGMSNNPSINIFNLGKPSYKKTAVAVGNRPKAISIQMRYW